MTKKAIAILLVLLMLSGCGCAQTVEPIENKIMSESNIQEVIEVPNEPVHVSQGEEESSPNGVEKFEEKKEDPATESLLNTGSAADKSEDIQIEQTAASLNEPEPAAEVMSESTNPDPPVNAGTIFEGFEVTVYDWTTPADRARGKDWPITTWYFFAQNGDILGSISGSAMNAITVRYQVRDSTGANVPPDGSSWERWFAQAFNEYRQTDSIAEDVHVPQSVLQEPSYKNEYESDKEHPEQDFDTPAKEKPLPDAKTSMPDVEEWAMEVIELTNAERERYGLHPLEVDADLMALAMIRAEEVSIKYSHERPDGTRVAKEYGYGENAGAKSSPQKQVSSWMNSDGHRTNILIDWYNSIGVGCYHANNGRTYWVQIFSR